MAAPLVGAESSLHRNRITAATCSGGTHLEKSASGWSARLAGVSMTLGRTALQRTPAARYSTATAWAEGQDGGLGADVAAGAAEGGDRRPGRHADHGPAPALDQVGQHRLGDQVGRAQVEGELALELLHRRLVDQAARGVAADQVDQGPQGGAGRGRRRPPSPPRPRRPARTGRWPPTPGGRAPTRSWGGRPEREVATTRQPSSRNAATTAGPSPPGGPGDQHGRSPGS